MRESRALGLVWVRHIAVSWLFLGGSSLPVRGAEWVRAQPEGGEIKCVLPHPTIPDRVYVLLDTGVFRSDDGGQHWAETAPELTAVSYELEGLAIHPENPEMFFAYGDGLIYQSGDDGRTWHELATDLPKWFEPTQMIFVPGSPLGVLVSLGYDGIFRSEDGGAHWERVVIPALGYDPGMVADHSLRGHVYAWGYPGLYESLDGGSSWRRILETSELHSVVPDPTARGRLYALREDQVSVSADGGRTWVDIWGGVRSAYRLALDYRQTPPILYALSDGEGWRSERVSRLRTDRASWETIFEYRRWNDGYQVRLATSPAKAGALFICPESNGILTSTDSGSTIRESNSGLMGVEMRTVEKSAAEPDVLVAGTEDGRLFRSTDRGSTWAHLGTIRDSGRVYDVDVDPGDKNILYALGYVIWKSTDGGKTFVMSQSGLDPDEDYATELIPAPSRPGTVYASVSWWSGEDRRAIDPASTGIGGFTGVFRSTDWGDNWRIVSDDLYDAWDLIVDPDHADILYVTNEDGLWRSTRGGAAFDLISPPLGEGSYGRTAAIDPVTPRRLYFYARGKDPSLWVSSNGGRQWRRFMNGLGTQEVHKLLVDPNDHGVIYAGTDNGVYRRRVGAGPWSALGEPRFGSVDSLAVVGTESPSLMALTSNGGVFRWSE